MLTLWQDIKFGLRMFARNPGFTAIAVLTLALGIGANTAIFSVVDAVLLKRLPYPDPAQLVTVYEYQQNEGEMGVAWANFVDWRDRISAFEAVAATRQDNFTLAGLGPASRVPAAQVSPAFFSLLGVAPRMGRTFTEEETTYQTNGVAILTDAYWRQRYHADPHAIGRQIRVDGLPKTVIGVLPPGFRFLSSEARIYVPLASRSEDRTPLQRHSGGNVTQMIARLKPGASVTQAQAQIGRMSEPRIVPNLKATP